MNIFKHEFKMKRKSILIWSFSLVAFFIFYMTFYPALVQDSAAFESIMENFPEELLKAMGLSEGLPLTSLMGYYSLTFTLVQLAMAIQSANYGFAILSEEERELTADFLMTKPVSRTKIYLSKFFAAMLSLFITSLAVAIGSFMAVVLFSGGESYEVSHILRFLITLPIFQLVFLSLGMMISLLFRRVRSVLSLSMGLVIGLYVISSIRGLIDSELLGCFTPFYHFEPGEILVNGQYNLVLFLISLGIITVSLVGSFLLYKRRDIHSL